jgi:hypothetical protein
MDREALAELYQEDGAMREDITEEFDAYCGVQGQQQH